MSAETQGPRAARGWFTRDVLAILVTSLILATIVATLLGPGFLHIYIDPEGWMRLVGADVLATVAGVVGYVLVRPRAREVPR